MLDFGEITTAVSSPQFAKDMKNNLLSLTFLSVHAEKDRWTLQLVPSPYRCPSKSDSSSDIPPCDCGIKAFSDGQLKQDRAILSWNIP